MLATYSSKSALCTNYAGALVKDREATPLIASVIAHEIGHSLGLKDDTTVRPNEIITL